MNNDLSRNVKVLERMLILTLIALGATLGGLWNVHQQLADIERKAAEAEFWAEANNEVVWKNNHEIKELEKFLFRVLVQKKP